MCPATGLMEQYCVNGASCYYMVGSQTYDCTSCTDTTSCTQAASAACN
jgi:hypothetical protein